MTRRSCLRHSAAEPSASRLSTGYQAGPRLRYDDAVRSVWRPYDAATADTSARMLELVRHATLAPSSHNTQCWKFMLSKDEIAILPDFARRCPVVDPDDHHLFVSLGCAAENLVHAARAMGYESTVRIDGEERVRVGLEASKPVATPLFDAIFRRQCTRAEYDGIPLTGEELDLLERAGTGNGVRVLLLTGKTAMEQVLEYVIQANTRQLSDRAFVDELKQWVRFGEREAVQAADGLFARTSGNPAMPRWLGSLMFDRFVTPKSENDRYVRHLRSSAGIAIFVSDAADTAHWVDCGRCYERFALQASALGIRNAFVNQPVEVADLRQQFAGVLGLGGLRPDLVVRFGRGPAMPRSLRRPPEAVIV